MKNNRKFNALCLLVVLLGFLTACGSQATPTPLEGATKEAILAYSEPKTDSVMAGLKDNNYAEFSKDFDADMLKALPQAKFDEIKKTNDTNLGAYISRQVKSVIQQGDFYVVFYAVKFEKVDMSMRVIFRMDEPHQVSGLWFDK